MSQYPPERWAQVDAILSAALALPTARRAAYLDAACGEDAALRREADALLLAFDAGAERLGESVVAFLAAAPVPPAEPPPARAGPYRVLREIGRGGMGAVYLAVRDDGADDTPVAIKLVKRGMDTDEVLRRFGRERRILSRLEHPHIARLLDAGAADDGRPWIAMEYVDGESITQHCARTGTDETGRLDLFCTVCDAVTHAHRAGVVHRDLKPSNILIDTRGVVKLVDFGIARLLEDDGDRTRTGQHVLTPGYASPEQVTGEPITPASDVYSLGVLLHELLTGQRPGGTGATLPPPLYAVVQRALERDPRRRYASAAAFATHARRVRHRRDSVLGRARARVQYGLRGSRGRVAAAVLAAVLPLGAARTLLPPRAAPQHDTVAVFPFTVHGDAAHEYLAAGLVELVAPALHGAGGLRSVHTHAVLAQSGGLRAAPRAMGRRAAQLGAGRFVLGSVIASGGRLQLVAPVHDTNGRILTTVETRAGEEAELFELIDELIRGLIAALAPEADAPLVQVASRSTASLTALRAYLDGEREFRAGRYLAARDAFSAATAQDTGFALAHYRRALATEWSGIMELDTLNAAIEQALRHGDGLGTMDRTLLHAFAAYHRGDHHAAESGYRDILAERPNDVDAWFGLAEVLFHSAARAGRALGFAAARVAFERVLALDPEHAEALLHLVRLAAWEARHDDVARYAATLAHTPLHGSSIARTAEHLAAWVRGGADVAPRITAELHEEGPVGAWLTIAFVAQYGGDVDGALGLTTSLTHAGRPPPVRGAGHTLRAALMLAARRDADALAELHAAARFDPMLAAHYRALWSTRPGQPAAADELRAVLHSLHTVRSQPSASETMLQYITGHGRLTPVVDAYVEGLLQAALGDLRAARVAADSLARRLPAAGDAAARRIAEGLQRGLHAELRLREGDAAGALAQLDSVRWDTWHQAAMGSAFAALARERALRVLLLRQLGRDDEAADWTASLRMATPFDRVHAARLPAASSAAVVR